MGLRDEHCFDGVRLVHPQKPFARAVLGGGIADDHRRIDACERRELLAQSFREIAHAREIRLAALVNPLQELARAERFLALLGEETGQRRGIHADQVHRENTSQPGKK